MIFIRREYGTELCNFKAWGGGKDTLNALTHEQIHKLDELLNEWYPDYIGERELNNLLWDERNYIADLLGFADFDELVNNNKQRGFCGTRERQHK